MCRPTGLCLQDKRYATRGKALARAHRGLTVEAPMQSKHSGNGTWRVATAHSVEDETRNAELNSNRNPECWGDLSQLVQIEKIKFLGISRYKVELRF